MFAIGGVSGCAYPGVMAPVSQRTRRIDREPKERPNQIHALTKRSGMTYAMIGEALNAHETTISNLANGKQELTLTWMKKLAGVFQVRPSEIIEAPSESGLRPVEVRSALQINQWAEAHEWPAEKRYRVMVPEDSDLRGLQLYAAELRDQSMNRIWSPKSVIVFSRMEGTALSQIAEGRRYHVRQTRADGRTEETVKTLTKDQHGRFWLKPESDDPQCQQWIALEGEAGIKVELIGRVRYIVQRED